MDVFQIECLKDGTWSNKIPTCKIADCGTPAKLENGLVTFSTRNNLTTYKSEIIYSCQQPYYKMLHSTTGEPSMLNQPASASHTLGLRVRQGVEIPVIGHSLGGTREKKYLVTCLPSPCLRLASKNLGCMAVLYPHRHTHRL